MNRTELFVVRDQMSEAAGAIMKARNGEYAKDDNPFLNFENMANFLGILPERAFLMYLFENVDRLNTMVTSGQKLNSANARDKLLDIQNFAALLQAYLLSKETPT